MYGAVCDDTVGFFAVLTEDEPYPARVERPLRIETRGTGKRAGVGMIAAQYRRPAAACPAMRREERGRIDLEVPQPFVCDIRRRYAAFDVPALPEQQPAGLLRRPRRAVRANFRERMPCNSNRHADIAIQ